jgi:heme/copper-type cytochrome/quinol oxidase subunit 2
MKKRNKSTEKRRKIKSKIITLALLFFLFVNSSTVYAANKIESSAFGLGLKNLLNDASAYLLVLSPIAGGLLGIYFFIRKNAADEQDQKQWNKRLIITGICVVGAVLVSGTINVITGYFTTSV